MTFFTGFEINADAKIRPAGSPVRLGQFWHCLRFQGVRACLLRKVFGKFPRRGLARLAIKSKAEQKPKSKEAFHAGRMFILAPGSCTVS